MGLLSSAKKKIRVLVVDDSALMRKLIGDIFNSDPRTELAGTAVDGADALVKIGTLKPDVVTLDVEMPRKNGIETLEEIMRTNPLPVIMVSSLTQAGAEMTLKALSIGCVDFVGKPSGTISLNIADVGKELIEKTVAASAAHLRKSSPKPSESSLRAEPAAPAAVRPAVMAGMPMRRDIVAIASSTGGPMALLDLMPKLPARFPVPIVITQHMPKGFTSSFAKRLDAVSNLTVLEGYDGLELKPGMAAIAPGGSHMMVRKKPGGITVCELSDAPPVCSVKPAANVMFLSVGDEFGGNVVCVILTGMGRDGADGAVTLHNKGAYVIAESQKTCVVYGMPKAAAEAGIVDEVLPLGEIPDAIVRAVKQRR